MASKVASEITAVPIPTLNISAERILHGAAAIAIGGVDTGRQYENEQLSDAGIIRYIG